jgi:DNA ligase-1
VLKDTTSTYEAGRRGSAWRKVKRALATLDVVITRAERGHGKRAAVLSDYTFAVRDGEALVEIGKAYSGLTDAEIAALTAELEARTLEERDGQRFVEPSVVLEVAFDGLQPSKRHGSGFALRFPRIARIRSDKKPDDADTLATVRALFETQVASGHREESAGAPTAPARASRGSRGVPEPKGAPAQLDLFAARAPGQKV